MEYCTLVVPEQTPVAAPLMAAGTAGVPYTWSVRCVLAPAQFEADTPTAPDENDELKLTAMAVEPCPLVMVAVAGTVHE